MSTLSTVPILKKLRQEGSTFYTFSSAVNDSILLFSSDTVKMNFSKFVCLKLPTWENVAKQRLYKDPVELESVNDTSASDDPNTFFVKAYLQNYIENFTSIIDANRNDSNFSNFSEAAFWKSLQSVSNVDGAVDDSYKTLQLAVDSTYEDINLVTREKFKEIPTVTNTYEQIIQYVGDINMLNHVKSEGKEYLEVFAHIPTNVGRMSDVLLKYNEGLNANLSQVPGVSGDLWVVGQEDAYTNSPGSDKTYAKAVWDTNDRKYNVNTDKDFLQIDWNDIESETDKWNTGSFDFNAVLIYYDIWDSTNLSTKKRNLYGILLINSFEQPSALVYTMPNFKKYQPDANQAGNGFGFRFNLMFSGSTNQLTSEITINDYSTISMELYMEALQRINKVSNEYDQLWDIVLAQNAKMLQLQQELLSFISTHTL